MVFYCWDVACHFCCCSVFSKESADNEVVLEECSVTCENQGTHAVSYAVAMLLASERVTLVGIKRLCRGIKNT